MILYVIFISLFIYLLFANKDRQDIISVYFGVPGSGKTTFAAYLAKRDLEGSFIKRIFNAFLRRFFKSKIKDKPKNKVWSNVPITGTYKLDCKKDIGKYNIVGGRIIIDEAGIEYNNRNYKELDQKAIKFFKYHRHYETAIDVFSQSHEDMDITLRRLAQKYYVVKKSLIPYLICCKSIGRRVGIDEHTKQIIDEFYWRPFGTKWIFSPSVWKMFNTVSREELPEKEWEIW